MEETMNRTNVVDGALWIKGQGNGDATVRMILRDPTGLAQLVSGTTVPSATAGYAIGCLFIKTDNGAQYRNTGTAASCTFTLIGTISAGSVALANLAAGITPSHIAVYAGKITWSGSGASLATTVTGVAATDVVVASIQTAPTQAAYLVSAAPTLNTITLVLSAANTSNQAVISYTVFRAAA
jgi:hypothetical protein